MRMALVMMFSLLPVSAAAVEHEPTIKWGGLTPFNYTLSVQVYYENKGLQWEKTETEKHLWVDVHPASGTEVYKADSDGGSYLKGTGHFTFGPTKASLKLYTRSTAGHTVTVNYVFKDASGNTKAPVTKSVKYNDTETFELTQDHYDYTIKHESGDATHKVDAFNRLSVTGGAENSVFTVTYTPKDNVITIDQYYNNGTILAKWVTNIKVNGLDIVENNKLEKGAIIDNTELTDATEKYRFLTVGGKTYDFSYARQIPYPGESSDIKLAKVWYERDTGEWYYAHLDNTKLPLVNKSGVNFCYNKEHTEASEHHQFDQVVKTVPATCTEKGYTDYKCKYCDKTKRDGFTDPLGHDWEWKHDDTTSGAGSQHYQVCKREGCNATSTPVGCKFDLPTTETGKHTCTVCGYSYTDEVTPTETPVYVYFKTVHSKDGNVRVNDGDGVTYNNNTGGWATLGKLTTEQTVAVSTDKTVVGNLGAEVNKTNPKFVKHQDNENFDLDLISEWVELKKDNGAAGYVKEAPFGTEAWHLNGKVNVYKLSYNANRPVGVTASVTVPDSAYYLPGRNATVSTDDPTLQGYVFGGWYTEETCENKVENTVAVAEDTVLYAKWTLAQPTADLVDDAITIYHQVNSEADWHGEDIGANMTYNYTDTNTNAHPVPKAADAKISYKAVLDMSYLDFGSNPQNRTAVDTIKAMGQGRSIWEYMQSAEIAMFAGSEVNLHVKFDEKLNVTKGSFDSIELASDWFRLADGYQNGLTKDSNGYWTIPCVIKDVKETNNSPIITLSGITLPLTDAAQGELSSGKDLEVISEGYIDGTIKISAFIASYTLKLEGKSKDEPAENTAKLKLAVPTYTVTYTDGANGSAFKDQVYSGLKSGVATPAFNGTPTRSGYTFNGWTPAVAKTVTGDATYTATWSQNSSHDDDDKYFFAIQKVDAQDGHALNGAKFKLYQLDKNDRIVNRRVVETRQQSSKNGIALFGVDNKNSYDGIWYYAEVSAPEGYVLDNTEHKIKATDFSDSLSTAVKYADTVRNYRGTTPDLLNDSDHFAYVIGYMDGNVRPYGLISRAETTTIFFRLLKDSVRDGNLLTSNTYTDVADDYWANTAISTMTGLGIVQGRSTTTFDPKAPITRAQFAAICARFDTGKSNGSRTFSDIEGHWAKAYIERAAELGWISGFQDGTFRPDAYITRAQAVTMINRMLNRLPEDPSDLLPGMNVWPDCSPGDWFYLAIQEATNSHDYRHKAGSYETWTGLNADPDWTRYEN